MDEYFNQINTKMENHFEKVFTDLNVICNNMVEKMVERALKKKGRIHYFQMNNIFPKLEELGNIKLPLEVNKLENIDFHEQRRFKLNSILNLIDDIFMMSESDYIIAGVNKRDQHIIVTTDKEFTIKNIITGLDNDTIKFKENEIKFASDSNEFLYISLQTLNKIFVCRLSDLHKKVFSFGNDCEDGEKNIDGAIDIFYYKEFVYILDSNKRIQVYSSQGVYEKSIYLYVPNLKSEFYDIIEIKKPQQLEIFNNLINILSNNEYLYVFNLDGEFIQSIESRNSKMCSTEDKLLLTLNTDNKLMCYEKSQNNNEIHLIEIFSKLVSFQNSNDKISIMRKYQTSNLLTVTTDCQVIVF